MKEGQQITYLILIRKLKFTNILAFETHLQISFQTNSLVHWAEHCLCHSLPFCSRAGDTPDGAKMHSAEDGWKRNDNE